MTATRPRVLLALTPIAEKAIEAALFAPGESALNLVASVADADELPGELQRRHADIVLVSAQLTGLTPAHCARLHAHGARVVGLALDDHDRQTLRALEITDTITPTDSADDLAQILADTATPTTPPREHKPAVRAAVSGRGAVVAVVGSKGAPGSSQCAASLARIAAMRWSTLLVDLDGLGSDLAVALPASADSGSIASVLRATRADTDRLPVLLGDWVVRADGWPPTLLGPDGQLDELAAPGGVRVALDALAEQFAVIVCDVGFLNRDAASIAVVHADALLSADAVVVVLGAREGQLRHGIAQLDHLLHTTGIPTQRLRVVVNAIGGPATPSRASIDQALLPALGDRGLAVDAWLPWDAKALARATRDAAPLATARPRGRYARALLGLLDELFLPDRAVAPAHKQRLAAPMTEAPDEVGAAVP
jgi:Flp pilus assembly CpaE family ATPase